MRMPTVLPALALVPALALAGCTSDPASTWTGIDLPAGFTASRLVDLDGHLVVAGNTGEEPGLLALSADGDVDAIPLAPASYYGARARWTAVVADDGVLRALGGRTGGGHGNPRWSTWIGDRDGLVEQTPPGMEVFGGWRGGGLAGLAVVDGTTVIVGSRTGEEPGFDITLWVGEGDGWRELPSTGTPLASVPGILPVPTSVVVDGDGLLVTGSTQRLGGGEVRDTAAVWIGSPEGPWSRVDLPSEAAEATALAATCDEGACVVVGRGDGRLLVWSLVDGVPRELDVPEAEIGDVDLPAPVLHGARWTIVAPDGDRGIVLSAAVTGLDAWKRAAGPAGVPLAAVDAGGMLAVLAADDDGSVRLWTSAG